MFVFFSDDPTSPSVYLFNFNPGTLRCGKVLAERTALASSHRVVLASLILVLVTTCSCAVELDLHQQFKLEFRYSNQYEWLLVI